MKLKSVIILMLAMGLIVTLPILPALAKEGSSAGTHTQKLAEEHHTPEKHVEHEHVEHENAEHENAEHNEPAAHKEDIEHQKHDGHGGHKEYPKLAEGVHRIAYFAIGFITFVLIAVPIGAHLEKKNLSHPSHH